MKNLQSKVPFPHLEFTSSILVFGGTYGNLEALEELKRIADNRGIAPSNIINTGDISAYCPNPEECVNTIRNWGINNIFGNVEESLAFDVSNCGCNFQKGSKCDELSKNWYNFVSKKVSAKNKEWFKTLPEHISFSLNFPDCKTPIKGMIVHGAYKDTSKFVFKHTDWSVKEKSFFKSETELIIGGHCGLPFIDKKVYQKTNLTLTWVNTGALGMPANDGNACGWFAILEPSNELGSQGFNVKLEKVNYNSELTARKMLDYDLPKEYAKTIIDGYWDNEDCLKLG